MPSQRPNLILDEQSFQDLLSAAFTIQEHNDWLQRLRQTEVELDAGSEARATSVCAHCGAPKPAAESNCSHCGLGQFRPGELMQRKWASMWLMSQEQRLWPERSQGVDEVVREDAPETLPSFAVRRRDSAPSVRDTETIRVHGKSALDESALDQPEVDQPELGAAEESEWTRAASPDLTTKNLTTEDSTTENMAVEDSELAIPALPLFASDDSYATEATAIGDESIDSAGDDGRSSLWQRFAELRVTLRFHRADVYLGAAVVVTALALLWPAAASPRRAALGPWEKLLVTLGLAEAPTPVVHLQGDPSVNVWVDPHTALYYCPGEELYGKTADGRISSQREAQMDRFEPAGRSVCE
ncbi:MAG: hypothetical protein WCF68_20490 [Terriglobales bacterium]